MAYLDNNGVLYLWGKIKAHVSAAIGALTIPTKTSDITNDSGFITSADVPSYPSMATNPNTSDWMSGKVVDAAVLKAVVSDAVSQIGGKADASALNNYALKTDIASMYKYKGSVATVSALPSSDNTTGDVYNVESTGMNYAWNGSAWDALGETFSITAITNAEIDTICT